MSFFNPIRSQFRRLEKVFRDDPALDLSYAAGLMKVSREKVPASIQKMIERQYFTPDVPVVDNRLSILIRDKRYLELGRIKRRTQQLQKSLQKAGTAADRVLNAPRADSAARSQAIGSFVRDVVDSALGVPVPRGSMRSRTGSFLREMWDPDNRQAIARFVHEDISGALTQLVSLSRQLADCLSNRPDHPWSPEIAPFLEKVTAMVDAWSACIPSSRMPSEAQLKTAYKLSDRLEYEFVPQFQNMLENIYNYRAPAAIEAQKPKAPEKPQETPENPILSELETGKRTFRNQLRFIQSPALQDSGAQLDQLVGQIIALLAVSPDKCFRAPVRSLRGTYLPMMQELLNKYADNEKQASDSPAIQAAMKTTEQLFENELPSALKRILEDLQQDSALDMASQAEALRDQLELDGLVRHTPGPGQRK